MRDAFRSLIDQYCVTLARQTDELGRHLQDARSQGDTAGALEQAIDLAHQLAGLSGTMGYAAIGEAAKALENEILQHSTPGAAPCGEALDRISGLFATVADLADAAKPEHSTLYNADFSKFETVDLGVKGRAQV